MAVNYAQDNYCLDYEIAPRVQAALFLARSNTIRKRMMNKGKKTSIPETDISSLGVAKLKKHTVSDRFEFDIEGDIDMLWQEKDDVMIRIDHADFLVQQDGDGDRKLRRVEVRGKRVLKDGGVSDRNVGSVVFTSAYIYRSMAKFKKEQRETAWTIIQLCGMQNYAMADQDSEGYSWWDASDYKVMGKSEK